MSTHKGKVGQRRLVESELMFLMELARGPRMVAEGPLGRCLKRGWCTRITPNNDTPDSSPQAPTYAITQDGLDKIAQAKSGKIRVRKR
jgi:hypothetical protein